MSTRAAAAWVAAFAVLTLVSTQLIETEDEGSSVADRPQVKLAPAGARTVKVLRIVDGDTILVRGTGGRAERVRYIGVDTPESVKEDTPVQCFGHEAAAANRRMVEGASVRLVPDQEPTDKYGRTLAYVYAGEEFVNAELVEQGYARTLKIPPNTTQSERFARLQSEARRNGRGLWSACRR